MWMDDGPVQGAEQVIKYSRPTASLRMGQAVNRTTYPRRLCTVSESGIVVEGSGTVHVDG